MAKKNEILAKPTIDLSGVAVPATTPVSEPAKPSANMLALFAAPAGVVDSTKLVRRNLPAMVKPGDVPLGGIVSGEILKIVDSPVSTVKGKLLWLKHSTGQEFLFPCTGVIRNALAPGKDGKELAEALDKEVGNVIIAKRTESKPSKYKKEMFMFDVFTAPAPAAN